MGRALRILLVEPDAGQASWRAEAVVDALPGARVATAPTAQVALDAAQEDRYDAVVASADLPDAHGLDLLRRLRRADPERPVLLLLARGSEGLGAAALKAGAAEVLDAEEKPDVIAARLAAVCAGALEGRRRTRLLELADRLGAERDLRGVLAAAATGAALALDGDAASVWTRLGAGEPAEAHLSTPLLAGPEELLSGPAPAGGEAWAAPIAPEALGLDGYRGAATVRAGGPHDREVLIVLARHGSPWGEEEVRWLELLGRTVMGAIVRIEDRDRSRRGAAGGDPATGLPGAWEFHRALEAEGERGRRHRHRVALILVEVTPGLDPVALDEVATAIGRVVRRYDVAARLEDDRFGILLPHADRARAELVAARVRDAVRACESAEHGRVDAACGVAAVPETVAAVPELLGAAEAALLAGGAPPR